MNSTAGTLELVLFKIKDGNSENEVIEAASKLNQFIEDQPGFISRTLSKSEDGTWKDLVLWTNLESAQKASEKVMQEACVAEFFAMIDESTMQFLHFEPKMEFSTTTVHQL